MPPDLLTTVRECDSGGVASGSRSRVVRDDEQMNLPVSLAKREPGRRNGGGYFVRAKRVTVSALEPLVSTSRSRRSRTRIAFNSVRSTATMKHHEANAATEPEVPRTCHRANHHRDGRVHHNAAWPGHFETLRRRPSLVRTVLRLLQPSTPFSWGPGGVARRCIETAFDRLCNRCPRLWCTWLLCMAAVTTGSGVDGERLVIGGVG